MRAAATEPSLAALHEVLALPPPSKPHFPLPLTQAVAAADQENVLEVALLHRLDHLPRHAQHRVARVAGRHVLGLRLGGLPLEAGQLLRPPDQLRVVLGLPRPPLDVPHARPAHLPRGEDAVGV
jgi:hypothetical protein